MKEAFWGVLIIMLGSFGIVIINVFQKATTTNDEVYYVIKEATEAAMYDSIDLTYYRLNGEIRTVEDKFVENLWKLFDFDHQNCAFKIKEIRNETYQQEPIIKYEPYKVLGLY